VTYHKLQLMPLAVLFSSFLHEPFKGFETLEGFLNQFDAISSISQLVDK